MHGNDNFYKQFLLHLSTNSKRELLFVIKKDPFLGKEENKCILAETFFSAIMTLSTRCSTAYDTYHCCSVVHVM